MVKVSTVVRTLVSLQCGLDFNPVEAVMSAEFVVGSCNCFKRTVFYSVVVTSPLKLSFPHLNSVRVETTNCHSDFWIKQSFSQFIHSFIRRHCHSPLFYSFINSFIHLAK